MSPKARRRPEHRTAELTAAALEVFREKGVASTTVSDIVKAAGVAQGTFYLYFDSKDDVINAVVERMVDTVVEQLELATRLPGATAVDELRAMSQALVEMSDEPHEVELMQFFHRPENHAVHDRLMDSLIPRLVPLVSHTVAQGVEEGVFVSDDPDRTAKFVLGSLSAIELGFSADGLSAETIEPLLEYVMRGLGHCPDPPPA